jgi:hypothetical protein
MARRPAPTRIAERSVTTEIIDVNAVTNIELAPDSVTTESIADGSITIDLIDPATQDELGGIDSTSASTPPLNPQEGDFWIDTGNNNELKRYNASTSSWVSVRDLTIATAQSAATAAQSTADGKNKVFRQTSAPTATAAGDLWFDTDDDNRIYRWDGTTWVANNLGNNAIASLSANKITAGTIDASVITVSNINAGNISTGTIAAGRISSSSISAGVIDASKITTGTLGASVVYAGNLSAGQITVGTLSGIQVQLISGLSSVVLTSSGRIQSTYNGTTVLINNPDAVTLWTTTITNSGDDILTRLSYYGMLVEDPSAGVSSWIFDDSIGTEGYLFTDRIRTWGDLGIRVTNGWGFAYDDVSAGPGNANFMALRWDAPNIIGIVDNDAYAVLGTSSDARGKMNIADAEDEYLDATYNKFRVVSYNPVDMLDEENLHLYPKRIGVIAQEVKEFAPVLTIQKPYDSEAMMTVNYLGIVPYLIQAVQDLNDRLKTVEGV